MKSLLVIISAFIFSHHCIAQNVGIGTTSPQATLDINGNQRLGGVSHFMTFDSIGGRIEWRNSNLYVPVSQYLMQHSAAADGLYYNNTAPTSGQLEYRNQFGNPVFFTNFINGNSYFSNRLGIGNLTPQFPLSFNGALGDKISLWTDGTPTHYGFGIQSGLFQMFSKTDFDDIAFGYGSSSAFVEAMRIRGNGKVGIGIITPTAKLSISSNGTELAGTAVSNTFWTNAGTLGSSPGSEISLANIGFLSNSNSSLGIRAYRSSAGTDWTSTALLLGYDVDNTVRAGGGFLAISANGNIGIRTATPNAPLSFPPALGKKITLYPGATGDVGMGVQGNLLQIYSDHPAANIAFGYDQGGVLTERMRINGNGNVGIGTSNPQYPLDIIGRMRLSGTSPFDPGIWFNDAGLERAFVGLENNNYVGFYGAEGAGWKFSMNTQTGALKINGSEGLAGQVLQSNGNGTTATWGSSTNALYNNTNMFRIAVDLTTIDGSPATLIPGFDYIFTVSANAKALVSFTLEASSASCAFCGSSASLIDLYLNSGLIIRYRWDITNNSLLELAGSYLLSVGPGTHRIQLFAKSIGPAVQFISGPTIATNMIVQVIPQ